MYAHSTISEIAAAHPASPRVFHKYNIDFCCGGKRALSDVCAEKNIAAEDVIAEIAALAQEPSTETNWQAAPLPDLITHIVTTHHDILRQELPRLYALCARVAQRHGGTHPHLTEMFDVYCRMAEELGAHIEKEERILFPAIASIAQGTGDFDITHPVFMMEQEHDDTGRALEDLARLSGGYAIDPSYMCTSFKALYTGLAALDADIRIHIHKENNILFPRALALLRT